MDRILGSLGADTWEWCSRGGPRYLVKMTRVVRSTRWVSIEVPLLAQKLHACVEIKLLKFYGNANQPSWIQIQSQSVQVRFPKYNPLEETDPKSNLLNANENSCKRIG